jgi:hypothetical protein
MPLLRFEILEPQTFSPDAFGCWVSRFKLYQAPTRFSFTKLASTWSPPLSSRARLICAAFNIALELPMNNDSSHLSTPQPLPVVTATDLPSSLTEELSRLVGRLQTEVGRLSALPMAGPSNQPLSLSANDLLPALQGLQRQLATLPRIVTSPRSPSPRALILLALAPSFVLAVLLILRPAALLSPQTTRSLALGEQVERAYAMLPAPQRTQFLHLLATQPGRTP